MCSIIREKRHLTTPMRNSNTAAFLPLVPGMRSSYYEQMAKPHFRRGQVLERMSMGKCTTESPSSTFYPLACATKAPELRPATTTQTISTQPDTHRVNLSSSKYRFDSTQPTWLTYDRLVLRFFAYFTEPIQLGDGRTDERIRRVVVCFYLSDRSISISEPRVVNSGIPQGEFMRRTIVQKTKNTSQQALPCKDDRYTPQDFAIGGKLRLYGRVFHIVDCDAATRKFYAEALNEVLAAPRAYPDESNSTTNRVKELKHQLQDGTRALGASKAEMNRKFHDLSQKVLRFYVSWHDNHLLYPETRRFILHYYLVDDTIEIVEARDGNRAQGRGHFSVLLSRRKLPRELKDKVDQQQNEKKEASYFITEKDLRCGEWINVFSRRMLLEDCDAFTRDYYLETYDVTQEPFEQSAREAPAMTPKWQVFQATSPSLAPPASNGRGTSGYSANNNNSSMQGGLVAPIPGSLSYERSLVTSLCRDDDMDGKQLRFRARFQGLSLTDTNAQRDFVVTYFLEDETIAVFEPRVRNSGVLGGRFLDRGRFRKDPKLVHGAKAHEATVPLHYQPSDMYVGAVLVFEFSPYQRLELVEADAQTLSFCESHPEVFRFSDSSAVLALVANVWMNGSGRVNLRCEWRQLDSNRSHFVSMENMTNVLNRAGLTPSLNKQQMLTLFRRFSPDERDNNSKQKQTFAYDDFCDVLSCLTSKPLMRDDSAKSKLLRIPRLRQLLACSASNDGLASVSDLVRIVNDRSVSLSKPEVDMLIARFASSKEKIDIHRLCDDVFQLSADQDKAADVNDVDFCLNSTGEGHEEGPIGSGRCSERSASEFDATSTLPQSVHRDRRDYQTLQPLADPRVVSLLQRVFGAQKYKLRKALRDRDVEKSGRLGEDEFMDALLSIVPHLSDDDAYLLADSFFPTNNGCVDYPHLLENAFRSSN